MELLGAGVVVLNNVPIDAIPLGLGQLARYARDLGGSVVIGGGATRAGQMATCCSMSLAAGELPPTPTNDLFVIVDSSGSMASPLADGRTKLDVAVDAMLAINRVVPGLGHCVRRHRPDMRWWTPTQADRVKRPDDLAASGPTNLAAAIKAVIDATSKAKRLILSATARPRRIHLPRSRRRGKESGIQIDWLGRRPRKQRASGTNRPRERRPDSPRRRRRTCPADAKALARSAMTTPMTVGEFDVTLPTIGQFSVKEINQTFPRNHIQNIASIHINGVDTPVVASWNVGVRKVTTLAFALDPASLGAFASTRGAARHTIRAFVVRMTNDAIEVDARDAKGPMNLLPLTLHVDRSPPTPFFFFLFRTARPRPIPFVDPPIRSGLASRAFGSKNP